jgi:signal transduction histidine kinase
VDYLVQFLLVVILGQWFISSFRKRHINKQNRLDQQKVLDEERNLDEARSNFITIAIQALSDKVQSFDTQLVTLSNAGYDISRLRKGFDQLKEMISKFSFATGLRAMAVEANKTKIDSTETVTSVAQRLSEKAAARNIGLQSQAQGGQFTQNQQLLNTVLDSLADNAVKYSPENAPVTLHQGQEGSKIYFAIEDSGPGLTKEQLDLLFKPFSRAESAETFNTEGLGFSLYLDRLIAHYLGGDIEIRSVPNQSTVAQLSLPGV